MRATRYLPIALLVLTGLVFYGGACRWVEDQSARAEKPPLADTLITIFSDLHQAVVDGDHDRFLSLLDPSETTNLERLTSEHGFSSLRTYLEVQFANWPNLDTLEFGGMIRSGDYARLTLTGPGSRTTARKQRLRYTFLLFRRGEGQWRLMAMSSLEKDRYDPYGYEVSYHETDLPPKLRFPRRF